MTDNEAKITALMALAANFGKEFPDSLLLIWLDLLRGYSVEAVNAGVRKVIADYEYKTLPPFAVLRRCMDRVTGVVQPERALEMAAEAEWSNLFEAMERKGRYNPPELSPTTSYVLRGMGGWSAVCNWETNKLEWRRKEFIEAWKLAHGHEEAMMLGADGVKALTEGAEASKSIVGRVLGIAAQQDGLQ